VQRCVIGSQEKGKGCKFKDGRRATEAGISSIRDDVKLGVLLYVDEKISKRLSKRDLQHVRE
jgi:hypothetical protein